MLLLEGFLSDQLLKAKETDGVLMVQIAEFDSRKTMHVLGNGQQIETELAEAVGVKVFRVHQQEVLPKVDIFESDEWSVSQLVNELVKCIEEWQVSGRKDMAVEEIFINFKYFILVCFKFGSFPCSFFAVQGNKYKFI